MTPAATLRFSRHATFALVPYRTLPLAQHHQLTDVAALVPERAGQGARLAVLLALDPVLVPVHPFEYHARWRDLDLD